jgi:hypothetical protein
MSKSSHESNIAGILRVEVLAARNLSAAVLGSLLKWTPSYSNPYVVLNLSNEEFISSTKVKTLDPMWKDVGILTVPLPTEQEIIQTHALNPKKTESSRRIYQPCFPEIRVRVFHQLDQQQNNEESKVEEEKEEESVLKKKTLRKKNLRHNKQDKLIGETIVSIVSCILSSTSTQKSWYPLQDEEGNEAGQIQLAIHFDTASDVPRKGDIVRIAGFGGLDYYSKILQPGARLEVVDVYQDQVFTHCKSLEGWDISFEFHRNLIHVVRRPSLLKDAQSQLQGQIARVQNSHAYMRAENMWRSLPPERQQQVVHTYNFALFSGGVVYELATKSLNTTWNNGLRAGVWECFDGTKEALSKVSEQFSCVDWRGINNSSIGTLTNEPESGTAKSTDQIKQKLVIVDGFGADSKREPHQDDDKVEDKAGSCPEQLICPITGCPMEDPVVAADGHSYDREAILQWFASSTMSPMTGMRMQTTQVFPNFTLRQLSEEFQKAKQAKK